MNCELMLAYDTPALQQTGSRNLTGQKTFPTIWGTYMKFFVAFFSVTVDGRNLIFGSQASYRYTILWVAFLDLSDSYFLFADLVGFYTH
jgi:hypothetical protein